MKEIDETNFDKKYTDIHGNIKNISNIQKFNNWKNFFNNILKFTLNFTSSKDSTY